MCPIFKNTLLNRIATMARVFFLTLGGISVLLLSLSFTSLPFYWHRWLGEVEVAPNRLPRTPEKIIMLGGGGMPSESNLMRLYYVSILAEAYPKSMVVIAHPHDSAVTASMRNHLTKLGVDSMRISFSHGGTNTRSQVLALKSFRTILAETAFLLVTSPEHMRRSYRAFQREGFQHVYPVAAFENAMFLDLDYDYLKMGGKPYLIDVSSNDRLRYDFWNYLKLEIICIRESIAMAYYWLNDWI